MNIPVVDVVIVDVIIVLVMDVGMRIGVTDVWILRKDQKTI